MTKTKNTNSLRTLDFLKSKKPGLAGTQLLAKSDYKTSSFYINNQTYPGTFFIKVVGFFHGPFAKHTLKPYTLSNFLP